YRLVTWLALASLVWLVDPMRLSEWTWSRQLRTGTDYQKQEAVKSLARVGKSARGSQLDGITFSQSALDSLDFTGSSLKNANFQSAFLVEANFSEANITGARFEAANLFGAQLETAIGLEEATCDRYTILSPEFSCQGGNLSREPREPAAAEPEADDEHEAEAEIERRVQDRLRGRKL